MAISSDLFSGFQSTPPRGRRLYVTKPYPAYLNISIHAPTREATSCLVNSYHPQSISIHAPTREATPTNITATLLCVISIHAPTREATLIG